MQIGSLLSGIPAAPSGASEAMRPDSIRPAASKDGVPFAQVMSQFLQGVDQQQHSVTQDIQNLATGDADNIHQIAINVAQADIAFRMAMEVRDKVISAYQEVMRMQV